MSTKTQTAVAQNNPRSMELELFQFTKPDFGPVAANIKPGSRKNAEGKVTGLSLSVESRKTVAKALDLPTKDSRVTEAILATTDAMKQAALQEVIRIASSPEWTAASIRASVDKNGTRKAGFTFKTVDRTAVPREQLVRAMSMLSDDEKMAIIEAAEALRKDSQAIVIDEEKAITEVVEAPEMATAQ